MEEKKNDGKFTHSDFQQIIDIMNEDNKYYTPTIEEFHVGFEYEYKSEDGSYSTFADSKGEWKKKIFNNEAEYDYEELTEFQSIESALQDEYKRYGDVRVKHLDKEDIESLEWKQLKMKSATAPDITFYRLPYTDPRGNHDSVILSFNPNNNWVLISLNDTMVPGNTLFAGTVKNKSRLSLLMQMVGII